MAVARRLQAFLQESKVKFTAAKHPVVYTAQEIAAAQHVPGRQLAKCVVVKTDAAAVLAVLPAVHLIDLKKLKALLRAKKLSIGKEADIKTLFPDMEVGAMSPFGNLYGVSVIVDRELGESEEIVFNAGSHTDTIKMRYQDFARLVKPKTGAFGQPVVAPTKKAKKASKAKAAKTRPARKGAKGRRPAAKKKPAARRRKR